jgi:hypothetical protein
MFSLVHVRVMSTTLYMGARKHGSVEKSDSSESQMTYTVPRAIPGP